MITLQDIVYAVKAFFTWKTEDDINTQEAEQNSTFEDEYKDTNKNINVPATISTKLAILSLTDSSFNIPDTNARAIYMSDTLSKLWDKRLEKIVAQGVGIGGKAVNIRVFEGEIVEDVVNQKRYIPLTKVGDRTTQAVLLAETKKINGRNYQRWIAQSVENGNLIISQKTLVNGTVTVYEPWQIDDIVIPNVDRVLFAFFKCPVDNRKESDDYGVPITFGTEKLCTKLEKNIEELDGEFEEKRSLSYVDERAFESRIDETTGKTITVPIPKRVIAVNGEEDKFVYENHSPEIRVDSYLKYNNELARQIEQIINLAAGIISTPDQVAKTATEIEISQQPTSAIIERIQKSVENFINDYLYAVNVLANYYNLAPLGEWEISFDWGAPYKDMATAWERKKWLYENNMAKATELRQFEHPNETAEEAQAIIDDIEASEPSLSKSLAELTLKQNEA